MDAQRKVTAFVTRGEGEQAELLVFWHLNSGIQVPAGTVEEGESLDDAAVREAHEETALEGLELVRHLGAVTYDLPEGQVALRRALHLSTRPESDAPTTPWELGRVRVEVTGHAPGFTRVLYRESDWDAGSSNDFPCFEGWVADADLLFHQERHFYHFKTTAATEDRWRTIENGTHEFHLYWVPLVPKPAVLIPPQQEWLDRFYDALLEGTALQASSPRPLPLSPPPSSGLLASPSPSHSPSLPPPSPSLRPPSPSLPADRGPGGEV